MERFQRDIVNKIRKTRETEIELSLNLDGEGKSSIKTGCGFLDHMLELFAKHGGFDLSVTCKGDTYVDYHHTVEDIGIVLGEAFNEALGDMRGIKRYASLHLPMDEALILVAVDICGRDTLVTDLAIPSQKIGDFDTELVEEFFMGFTRNLKASIHIRQITGKNSHHIVEGCFKGLGRALREAVSMDERFRSVIPSTKGVL